MDQKQWDELKRLDALRNEDMRGVGLNRANEIMEAKLAFLKLLEASFPAILAERSAAQRLREALDGQADGIADAIDAFDAVVTK